VTNRGFIREGYFADLTLVDLNSQWTVARKTHNVVGHHWKAPLYYQSNADFVNGKLLHHGQFNEEALGMAIALTIKKSKMSLFQKTLQKQSKS
jgi:dihydroorotase